MTHHQLPPAAEDIRKEIKELIPETATRSGSPGRSQAKVFDEDNNGNKTYKGDLLTAKISHLTGEMNIGDVCFLDCSSGC